jgi:hypothetical protein
MEPPEFTNLQSILDGKEDAYLTVWGQASAAWGHPYFVRLMWEFTGSWNDNTPQNPGYGTYPWGNGNTPAIFVAAWQYIVDKVRAAGGTDISWIWCPAGVGDSVSTLRSLYPGDQYVDWVGTDVYIGPGQTFAQGAQPELSNIQSVAPNKPVMLSEIGYTGSDSASYWSNLLTNILPNDYPFIKAVVIWQQPDAGFTVTDSTTLAAFQSGIGSSYYSSNVYSSLNTSPITPIGENQNPLPTSTSQPTGSPTLPSNVSGSSSLGLEITVIMAVAIASIATVLKLISSKKKRTKEE